MTSGDRLVGDDKSRGDKFLVSVSSQRVEAAPPAKNPGSIPCVLQTKTQDCVERRRGRERRTAREPEPHNDIVHRAR